MSRPTTILITGLSMEASKRLVPDMDTVTFGKKLSSSMDTLNAVPGLHHEIFYLDPDAPDEAPNSVSSFKALARKGPPQGGQWDAHLLGAGLRMALLTPLFEDIINTIITLHGEKARVLLSANGMDHWEVVKRGFPELGMGERPSA